MKIFSFIILMAVAIFLSNAGFAQVTNALPGRTLVKLLPDFARPLVYALNQANGTGPGTVLALNATNGTVMNEIAVNLNPTDMTMSLAGDALYVINNGSRTISKIDLTSFTVVAEKAVTTPNTYNKTYILHLAAGRSNLVYFTDAAWAPSITIFDYANGTNVAIYDDGNGAGGLAVTPDGSVLYRCRQSGWYYGDWNSLLTRYDVFTNANLTPLEESPPFGLGEPSNTQVFLDTGGRWVFSEHGMFDATNVAVQLNQFSDNICGISTDSRLAFGSAEIFNTQNAAPLTNLPFATTVLAVSGDQRKLFLYNQAATNLTVYDLAGIMALSGSDSVPTPANRSAISLPLANLAWSASPVALSYDVYFGTNQAQVAGATPQSDQYQGRVLSSVWPFSGSLSPGTTYFWRVDQLGFAATNTGKVWTFTVSPVTVAPNSISCQAIAGCNPPATTLTLTSTVTMTWSAVVTGSNWLTVNPGGGTSPGLATLSYNTAGLPAGYYSNNVEFTAGALKWELPVTLTIQPLKIVKMAADRQRPYIYALQAPVSAGQNGSLLFINTTNGQMEKALPIGLNPTDLTISYGDGKLYCASESESATYVVDLNSQALLPPLNLGADVYEINAGQPNRLVTEGQSHNVNLIDASTGLTITNAGVSVGDGEFDPSGRYYYHVDNSWGANIDKFDLSGDFFAPLESVGQNNYWGYGSRNLIMALDGSRLFWTGDMYDANLDDLGSLGTEIYACSTNGAVAFGTSQAIDTATKNTLYNLPAASTVAVVDGQNLRYWYFNSATTNLGSIPMTLIQAPVITQSPVAQTTLAVSNTFSLTVTATGLSPLSYQWTCAGTNLPGATNYFLWFNNLQVMQSGNYQVLVSNISGVVTSSVANLVVMIPPGIASQPTVVSAPGGSNVVLAVSPIGSAPLTYQWFFNGLALAGDTNNSVQLPNVQTVNQGYYQIVLANPVGTATSGPILLRVLPTRAAIVTAPTSLTVPAGGTAVLHATVMGSAPLSIQWYVDGYLLAGINTPDLVISDVQGWDMGTYQVSVSNSLGSAISPGAFLTVVPAKPVFVLQPVPTAAVAGNNTTFTSLAAGTDTSLDPLKYNWYFQGTQLAGQTGSNLTLSAISAANQGAYYVVAANSLGAATSAPARLTVYLPPTIQAGVSNQVVDAGSTLRLGVNVTGTAPFGYTWHWNEGYFTATNAELTLSNISPMASGYYSVTVTNLYGSASSTTGRVSVYYPASSIVAWGDDSGGQTDVPTNLDDAVAVAGGDYHSVALRHDGTLLAWGYDGDGQTDVPTNTMRFVSIVAGTDHNLVIAEDGSLSAWGRNDFGQISIPPDVTTVLSVAAGDNHSLALLPSGLVRVWGDNTYGQTNLPYNLLSGGYWYTNWSWWTYPPYIISTNWFQYTPLPVLAIAAGRNHNLALIYDGTVLGWGDNSFGQASPPAGLANVMAIAAGSAHSVALCTNGTVVAWGDNSFGQTNVPVGLSNVVAIAAGDYHTYARRADGTVVGWGNNDFGQLNVPGGANWTVYVASGLYHGLALVQQRPSLQASLNRAAQLVIQWTGAGRLQWAPTPLGPYTDCIYSGQSYTNSDMSAAARFFRLRP